MSFAPEQEKAAFEKADAAARTADAKAAAARDRLEKLRAGNGKAAQGDVRAALRALNAEVSKTEKAAAANRAATERDRGLAAQARGDLERAEAAFERAKEAETTAAAMAKARSKLTAAQDADQAAQNMLRRDEQRQGELDGAASHAREKREKAIDQVIKHELPLRKLLAETQTVHDRLSYLRVILRRVLWEKLVEGPDKEAVEKLMRAPLPPHPDQGSPIDWNATPAAKAWDAMRQALAADADAPVEEF